MTTAVGELVEVVKLVGAVEVIEIIVVIEVIEVVQADRVRELARVAAEVEIASEVLAHVRRCAGDQVARVDVVRKILLALEPDLARSTVIGCGMIEHGFLG